VIIPLDFRSLGLCPRLTGKEPEYREEWKGVEEEDKEGTKRNE